MNNKTEKILLIAILAGGFVLRILAVHYALPTRFFSDEYIHLANALKMLDERTLFLNFSYLPNLFAYLLIPFILIYSFFGIIFGFFSGLGDLREFVILNSEQLLIFSRLLGAVFGSLSVYFVFLLARQILGKPAAFFAAVILTLLPIHLIQSQSGQFWSPLTFFILAGIFSLHNLAQTGEKRWYFWSAVMIGLGFGMGYWSAVLLPWLFFCHFYFVKKLPQKKSHHHFILSLLLAVVLMVFFSFANTYALQRQFGRGFGTLLDAVGLSWEVPEISSFHQQNNFFSVLGNISAVLWHNFYLQLILIAIGLWFLVRNKIFWQNIANYFLVVFPLTYFLVVAMVFNKTPDRYLLPALPFLAIAGGYGLAYLRQTIKSRAAFIIICLIFFLPQLYFTFGYSEKLLRTDTYLLAKNWIEKNLSSGSKIILDNADRLYLTPNSASLKLQQENAPRFLDSRQKLLLTFSNEQYPRPNYFIYDFDHLDLSKIENEDFSQAYRLATFLNQPPAAEESEQSRLLENYQQKLLVRFYPTKPGFETAKISPLKDDLRGNLRTLFYLERFGPRIEIYQLVSKK